MTVNATTIWRVGPSGLNTNGGGFDSSFGGTDYSQQNAAQASGSNATCTTGTSTFVDATANAFTSAMVGNAIWIASGTNFISSAAYIVTAFTSASTVTLDRTPVTASNGSIGVWKLGGRWLDFWTNTDTVGHYSTTAGNWIVPGNIIYILASASNNPPNPAAYTYDYVINNYFQPPNGSATTGCITFANDPNSPGYKVPPDTTGGMPTVQNNGGGALFNAAARITIKGLWFVAGDGSATFSGGSAFYEAIGCVWDQFGKTQTAVNGQCSIYGCEVWSSVSFAGANFAIALGSGMAVVGCNIHDCTAGGINLNGVNNATIVDNIIAKCGGDGIIITNLGTPKIIVKNNTIDGNTGHGINLSDQISLFYSDILNNIISNHTTAAKAGINIGAGTTAANDVVKQFVDYNVLYNNTSNYTNISAGPHDTALGVTPYVASGTENYTLA